MKKAYYFSEKQLKTIQFHGQTSSFEVVDDGQMIEFTEVRSSFEDDDEIPLQNNWDDSVLVHVKENLPVNEWLLKRNGTRYAKDY
jgi:hypothetical protein